MDLTGTAFFLLLIGISASAFVAAVILLPKMVGKWWWVLVRGTCLLLVNALVVLTAVVGLNRTYGWYSSWADLMGDQGTQEVHVSGAAPVQAAVAVVKGPGFAAFPTRKGPLPPLAQPGERLQNYTITGPESRATGPIQVYLPASYERDAPKGRTYPVIFAFHGFPTGPEGWTRAMKLPQEIDAAVAKKHLAESVVVVPQINIPRKIDTECVNGPAPGQPQMETWLARDVPKWVLQNFSVKRERGSWATIGYSLGAWCSAVIGVLHHDIFGASVSLGGYYQPDFGSAYVPFTEGSPGWKKYDLVALVDKDPPPMAMWVQSGSDDRFLGSTQKFLAAGRPPLSLTSVILPGAGHRVEVWMSLMPQALAWIGQLPGFSATVGESH